MHPLPDPLYVQNQALIWLGVLVAVVTGVINAYHSLKALWLSNANKERLDSQSTTLKTVLLNTSPSGTPNSQTVNAPAASTVNVSDTPAPPATGPEAAPTAPDLQALKNELTAHAEALKQQISDTPLTATLMGQIKASDLAAAHEQIKSTEIANAQETPVLPHAEAAQPVSAPAVSSDAPAPVVTAPPAVPVTEEPVPVGPAAEPDYPDGEGA